MRKLLPQLEPLTLSPTKDFTEDFNQLHACTIEASDLRPLLGALLRTLEAIIAILVPASATALNVFLRKAEVLSALPCFDAESASAIAGYLGSYIPLRFVINNFSLRSRVASVLSEEQFVSQTLTLHQDHRSLLIGSKPMPALRSDLPTSIQVIKEHDVVVVKEGPTTAPLAAWRLSAGIKYSMRSGLLFYIGSALLSLQSVKRESLNLRWKFQNQPYSPTIQLSSDVKTSWLLGRQPSCDILINDKSVSSRHALIEVENGIWTLTDLRSSNGTFQYLHTLNTLSSDSDEFLVTDQGQIYLNDLTSLVISLEPAN